MKKLLPLFLFTTFLFNAIDAKSQSSDKAQIEQLIQTYQEAVNSSDVNTIMSLYTEEAVFLPNAAPSATGKDQVQGTYQYVFKNLKLDLHFDILEIEVIGNSAFARSTSKGTLLVKANGETVPDENRELFVFEKRDGNWKIARYIYNKTS